MTFAPVDAGGPTIWQTLRWTSDGVYGNPVTPSATIRGLWRLEETSGLQALDTSGNGLNATFSGTSPTTGVFGNARALNGAGEHMRVGHNALLESGIFSLSLWVKPVGLNNRVLIDKRSGGSGYGLYTDADGRLIFQVGGSRRPVAWISSSGGP